MFNFRYGLWRTMTLRHHTIEFSLMEAGHTKFHPDWHFGLWKVRWRGSTVETMTEMAESVSQSSRGGHNIPQLVDDQESPVHFYDWSSYLKRFFKPIPQLTSYHHFRYEYTSNFHIMSHTKRIFNCKYKRCRLVCTS